MLIHNCDCKLCCEGTLPGVESHLFSEFLLKEAVNQPGKANATGKGSKGQELLFTVSPIFGAEMFFRGPATQSALNFKGKQEFTDTEVEELRTLNNPLTDTNLVCSKCEKLFQPVENAFKNIYDKLTVEVNSGNQRGYLELKGDQIGMTELFISMNIWRTSASKKLTWRLDDYSHQCLTELMYNVFIRNPENSDLLAKYIEAKSTYGCLSFIYFFGNEERVRTEDPNENFIFCYHSSNPYLIVVNRLVVFISHNNFDGVGAPKICKDSIDNLLAYIENHKSRIYSLNQDKLQVINKNYALENIDAFKTHLIDSYMIAYNQFCGTNPSDNEIQEMLKIANDHVGHHYKYGISESKLIEDLTILLYSQATR